MRLRTICAFVVLVATSGCGWGSAQETDRLRAENVALRAELETVKQELAEFKFGASHLLGEADAAAAKSNWAEAKRLADDLSLRHPESPEAAKAKALATIAATQIQRAEREAQAAQKRLAEQAELEKRTEELRVAAALGKMRKHTDDIEGLTWYRDRLSPQYANYNGFFIYIGQRPAGEPWLRLRVQYNADDWLFIESFVVVADGRRFEHDPAHFERDNDSEIWEWYDELASSQDIEMVKAIIAAKSAVIRFNGRQYRKDRTITRTERAALQNVLDAYRTLGGKEGD